MQPVHMITSLYAKIPVGSVSRIPIPPAAALIKIRLLVKGKLQTLNGNGIATYDNNTWYNLAPEYQVNGEIVLPSTVIPTEIPDDFTNWSLDLGYMTQAELDEAAHFQLEEPTDKLKAMIVNETNFIIETDKGRVCVERAMFEGIHRQFNHASRVKMTFDDTGPQVIKSDIPNLKPDAINNSNTKFAKPGCSTCGQQTGFRPKRPEV